MVFYELLWSIQHKFRENGDPGGGGDAANDEDLDDDFIYPESVKPYLEKFNDTAKNFKIVEEFVESVENLCFDMTTPPPLYLTAFAKGVDLVVEEFNTTLCEIEKMVLEHEDLSVISIAVLIDPVATALRGIADGINNIKKKEITGCQILDVCHLYANCGSTEIKQAYQMILTHCMKPFYRQTKLWILQAVLFDPHSEYFIEKTMSDSTVSSVGTLLGSTATTNVTRVKHESHAKYSIVPSRLPTIIPYSIAAKILFIGEMLTLHDKDSKDFDNDLGDLILEQCGLSETILLNRFEQIEKENNFNLYAFDSIITDIWKSIDKYARKLADDIGDARNQILQVRDIYLLGRGELFQEFLSRANSLLIAEPTNLVMRNLKVAFKNSVYYVYRSENLDLLESVTFKLSQHAKMKNLKTCDVLELDLKIRWPLQSLFPSHIMINFNKLFKFLLRLKRALMDILEVWMDTNENKSADLQIEAMVLRNNLVALVGNLQHYCFSDVIAKETNILMHTFDTTDTYTEIQKALVTYQENILQQLFIYDGDDPLAEEEWNETEPTNMTFVTVRKEETVVLSLNKRVRRCFKMLFAICQKFSLLVKQKKLKDHPDVIKYFTQKLNSSIRLLVELSEAADKNYSNSNLQNLVSSLDFNGYFYEKGSEQSKGPSQTHESLSN